MQLSGGLSPGAASPSVAVIGRLCCANRGLQPHLLCAVQHLYDGRALHRFSAGGGLFLLAPPARRGGLRPAMRRGLRAGGDIVSATRLGGANSLCGLPAFESWVGGPMGHSCLRPFGGLCRRPADLPTLAQGDRTATGTLFASEWGVSLGPLHPEALGAGSCQTHRDRAALSGLVLAPGYD